MYTNQTVIFKNKPVIIGSYSIVGPKEGKGNFGPYFNWNNQQQYSEGAGSGIIISKSDTKLFILTNNHKNVKFTDGKTRKL